MVKIEGRDHAMTAEQVLAAHGIQRPAEVVELAAAARLDLAAAATLLQKEEQCLKPVDRPGRDRR